MTPQRIETARQVRSSPSQPTVVTDQPRPPSYPETMEQARVWIDELRSALRRERAYVLRLEQEACERRRVVEVASFWHHARGMHRKPWLDRLKAAVREMEETRQARD